MNAFMTSKFKYMWCAIVYSSAATDETQTNWNGLLGYIRLREENPIFLSQVRVYPKDGGKLRAEIDLDTYDEPFEGVLVLKRSDFPHEDEYNQEVHTNLSVSHLLLPMNRQ